MRTIVLALAIVLGLCGVARADLVISSVNVPSTIDFAGYTGTGFQPTPAAGQLDSDTWAATGWNDGDLAFGGTRTTGDYARGSTTGSGVGTGGFYSLDLGGGNRAFWIQPGGSDWAPGTLTLRVLNSTGSTVSDWDIAYQIYNRNDQPRANSFNFSYSTDDVTYIPVPSVNFTSPEAADALGVVLAASPTAQIAAAVLNGGQLYLRWSGSDVSGSGARDEFGLDNIVVTAVPEPGAVLFGGLVCSLAGVAAVWRRVYGKKAS